jgi:uncharacterized protein (DUF1330 family)
MPKGYVIMTEAIRDRAGMDAYGRAAAPSMVGRSFSALAVDREPEVLEGEWHGDQTVIIEFESVDAARDWYTSAAYQAAAPLRHAAADTNAVIVSGLEPRPE